MHLIEQSREQWVPYMPKEVVGFHDWEAIKSFIKFQTVTISGGEGCGSMTYRKTYQLDTSGLCQYFGIDERLKDFGTFVYYEKPEFDSGTRPLGDIRYIPFGSQEYAEEQIPVIQSEMKRFLGYCFPQAHFDVEIGGSIASGAYVNHGFRIDPFDLDSQTFEPYTSDFDVVCTTTEKIIQNMTIDNLLDSIQTGVPLFSQMNLFRLFREQLLDIPLVVSNRYQNKGVVYTNITLLMKIALREFNAIHLFDEFSPKELT